MYSVFDGATYVDYIFWAVSSVTALLASFQLMHIMQLESYQGKMYLKCIGRSAGTNVLPYAAAGIVPLLLRAAYPFLYSMGGTVADLVYLLADVVYIALLALYWVSWTRKQHKKPFVMTGRIWRLTVIMFIVCFVFHACFFVRFNTYGGPMSWGQYMIQQLVHYLPGILLPYFVFIAWLIAWPVENAVKNWYLNDAKKKLASLSDTKRIAITGSFGKTTAKFALSAILAKKYDVLCTPGSFNTPMGVTRVIREQLKPEHQVFIAEMGARYVGDIKELCDLVQPEIGLITAVGKQHLETFGSLDNVIATKSELIRELPQSGACFISGMSDITKKMYDDCAVANKHLFGVELSGAYMNATDISVSPKGSRFTLTAEDGSTAVCETKLLGRHNILNIAGAAAVAYYCGLTMDEIAAGIADIQPIEHRLQLTEGAVTVIDDAFNANPEGAKEALEVLRWFDGERIIVTPGMVELGDEEAELNRQFGRDIASAADTAILVGKAHVEPIREGLIEKGFPEDRIVMADNLKKATELLPQYTKKGCVVLFENDLPDNYDEA